MIFNVTDENIAVSITLEPPAYPNGIIRYYRVQYVEASDPLADTGDTGDTGGRGKRNIPLDTISVFNNFANITDGGAGPRTSVTLIGLG